MRLLSYFCDGGFACFESSRPGQDINELIDAVALAALSQSHPHVRIGYGGGKLFCWAIRKGRKHLKADSMTLMNHILQCIATVEQTSSRPGGPLGYVYNDAMSAGVHEIVTHHLVVVVGYDAGSHTWQVGISGWEGDLGVVMHTQAAELALAAAGYQRLVMSADDVLASFMTVTAFPSEYVGPHEDAEVIAAAVLPFVRATQAEYRAGNFT